MTVFSWDWKRFTGRALKTVLALAFFVAIAQQFFGFAFRGLAASMVSPDTGTVAGSVLGGELEDVVSFDTLLVVPETPGADTLSITANGRIELQAEKVTILGQTTANKSVILSMNGSEVQDTWVMNNGKFTFYNVVLARGENRFRIADYFQDGNFSHGRYFSINYRSSTKRKPIILSHHYSDLNKSLEIIGLGEPDAVYNLSVSDLNWPAYCDNAGMFSLRLPVSVDSVESILTEMDSLLFKVDDQKADHGAENLPGFYRKMEVFVDSSKHIPRLLLNTRIPVASVLYEDYVRGAKQPQDLIGDIFGRFNPLWGIRSLNIEKQGNAANLLFDLAFKPDRQGYRLDMFFLESNRTVLASNPLFNKHDSLLIHVSAENYHSISHATNASYPNLRVLVGNKDIHLDKPFVLQLLPEEIPTNEARKSGAMFDRMVEEESVEPLPEDVISLIRRLPDKVFSNTFMRLLTPLIWGLFVAIPILWLLWLLYRHRDSSEEVSTRLTGLLCLLLFFTYADPVLRFSAELGTLALELLTQLYAENYFYERMPNRYFGTLVVFLFPAAASVFLGRLYPPQSARPGLRTQWVVFLLALCFVAVCMWLTPKGLSEFAGLDIPLLPAYGVGGVLALTLLFTGGWSIRVALRNAIDAKISIVTAIGIVAFLLLVPLLVNTEDNILSPMTAQVGWAIICCALGALLAYSFLHLSYDALSNQVDGPKIPARYFIIILLIFLTLPKTLIFDSTSSFIQYTTLSHFVIHLTAYFAIIFLPLLMLLLFRESTEKGYQGSELVRQIGIFLLAIYVVRWGYYYMYIPISFLLAYWLSDKLLFRSVAFSSRFLEQNAEVLNNRRESIAKLLEFLHFKRQAKALSSTLDKKYAEGDLAYDEWQKQVGENRSLLAKLKAAATHEGVPIRNIVFSKGIEASPWGNALVALKTGAVLAIPWLLVGIRDIRIQQIENLYPLLSILDNLIYTSLVWFAIAFVFGYFFELIRGHSGISKGLWLSAVILIARIGPAILFADSLEQIASVLTWAVQVVVFCVALGFFAFDYRVLKQNGFDQGEAKLIYNLAFLSTSGSGLAAALIGVLTGQLQEFFKKLLSGIFPG